MRWRKGLKGVGGDHPPKELIHFVSEHNHQSDLRHDAHGIQRALQDFVSLPSSDGYWVSNPHFQLQMARLVERERFQETCSLDAIYELHDQAAVFDKFVQERRLEQQQQQHAEKIMSLEEYEEEDDKNDKTKKPRHTKRVHLNLSAIDTDVQRKICQLSAIDYCCLNFPLPPACEGTLACRWTHVQEKDNGTLKPRKRRGKRKKAKGDSKQHDKSKSNSNPQRQLLKIEAVSPYPKLPSNTEHQSLLFLNCRTGKEIACRMLANAKGKQE